MRSFSTVSCLLLLVATSYWNLCEAASPVAQLAINVGKRVDGWAGRSHHGGSVSSRRKDFEVAPRLPVQQHRGGASIAAKTMTARQFEAFK
jgi:hypothetical protein